MEYCIAGDDGSAGIWNRPFDVDLDGDGRLDAIGLDLDGDGLRDDALADFDGDDVADHAVFDVDNDGTPESYFIDDGSGTWAVAVDRGGQLRWYGLDGVEHTGGPLVDFDGFGGAQAVALLAYGGTDTDGAALTPVDMITGPGNIYVTAAKRLCRSRVGIDAEAGPTEIAILADHTADPVHVAADLISQAEHDELAASVLVTPSEDLADATDAELAGQLQTTVHRERVTAALTGRQSAIVLVDDVDAAVLVVNAYAAEHLEIQTADAPQVASRIRSAGAIFVGPWSPVSLGDYCAGSNHVLPTAGCARHSSGLSVQTFLRGIHVVEYTEAALKDVSGHVITLATAEDLPAHGEAVRRRFER